MKIATIVAAVALATGSAAFAADNSYSSSGTDSSRHAQTTQNADHGASSEGLLAKTKRALHRLGEKMRSGAHQTANAAKDHDQDRTAMGSRDRSDTRAMGAAGDSGREQRMNKAYGNWQDKRDQDSKR